MALGQRCAAPKAPNNGSPSACLIVSNFGAHLRDARCCCRRCRCARWGGAQASSRENNSAHKAAARDGLGAHRCVFGATMAAEDCWRPAGQFKWPPPPQPIVWRHCIASLRRLVTHRRQSCRAAAFGRRQPEARVKNYDHFSDCLSVCRPVAARRMLIKGPAESQAPL